MLITAVLVAETENRTYGLLAETVRELLRIGINGVDKSGLEGEPSNWDLPQVHAINTLRTIYTEAKLSIYTNVEYLQDVIVLAIQGLGNEMYLHVCRSNIVIPSGTVV
jgi:THADA/TRM732, DUF2428